MESTRKNKISRLIQKNLGIIFQKETNKLIEKKMISVTKVYVSADFSSARIFISIFPTNDPKRSLNTIRDNKSILRRLLGVRLRNQLRIIPELNFHLDDSAEYADEIERLLKK